MDQREIALAAAKALDAKRGKDIVVLKVDEMTVITDYMVIATGRSVPQVKALAENVEEELAKLDVPRETIFVFRDRGTGRPTKKERRELDTLMDEVFYDDGEDE